jgi:hypothetical protein
MPTPTSTSLPVLGSRHVKDKTDLHVSSAWLADAKGYLSSWHLSCIVSLFPLHKGAALALARSHARSQTFVTDLAVFWVYEKKKGRKVS